MSRLPDIQPYSRSCPCGATLPMLLYCRREHAQLPRTMTATPRCEQAVLGVHHSSFASSSASACLLPQRLQQVLGVRVSAFDLAGTGRRGAAILVLCPLCWMKACLLASVTVEAALPSWWLLPLAMLR